MRREELYLRDIIEATSAIERFLENISKSDFLESELLQSAVLQKLLIIGEASSKISGELKSRYSKTPWKQITGFRNIAIHAYFSINWEIVWFAATKNAPALREQILKILETDFSGFEPENRDKWK
ncbi:MAG: HepT-like ribonuclease domain-containing protein [Pyrinomonadaceae bacterium]